MITIFNKKRKAAEYKLMLAEHEIGRLKNELKTHKINNLPSYPMEVFIEFHIGATKQVFFDGKDFVKDNGEPYRLASIKLWREL
mgnify:CR=1 FL=1